MVKVESLLMTKKYSSIELEREFVYVQSFETKLNWVRTIATQLVLDWNITELSRVYCVAPNVIIHTMSNIHS